MRQHPALWEGKGAGKGSLVCLSDKSLSVYLNPQCFFICLFKSFPAKKEQKEGGKPPPSVTPPHQDGAGALQGQEQDPGPEHPAPLPSAEPALTRAAGRVVGMPGAPLLPQGHHEELVLPSTTRWSCRCCAVPFCPLCQPPALWERLLPPEGGAGGLQVPIK